MPALLTELQAFCNERFFAPGEQLRRRGEHYRQMYLLIEGEALVDFGSGTRHSVKVEAGDAVGEMSFLSGKPATAEVVSLTAVRALELDDTTLARFESKRPGHWVALLQLLGQVVDDRTAQDLIYAPSLIGLKRGKPADILLARDADMLSEVQRLRYDIYCIELGRDSPNADHERRIIADALDEKAYVFLARSGEEAIGTLRVNLSSDGSLGLLECLYGMDQSPHHPLATGICSKFIVTRAHRRGPTARQLIAAAVRVGMRHDIKECYIDTIPQLLPYYRAMGFQHSGEKFLHVENGPSFPLKLDLKQYGPCLVEDMTSRQLFALYMRSRYYKAADTLTALTRADGTKP